MLAEKIMARELWRRKSMVCRSEAMNPPIGHPEVAAGAAAALAEDPQAVRVIDQQHRAVAQAQANDGRQVRHVAFHAEHPVHDHHQPIIGVEGR
jgi:hypothetical protein